MAVYASKCVNVAAKVKSMHRAIVKQLVGINGINAEYEKWSFFPLCPKYFFAINCLDYNCNVLMYWYFSAYYINVIYYV